MTASRCSDIEAARAAHRRQDRAHGDRAVAVAQRAAPACPSISSWNTGRRPAASSCAARPTRSRRSDADEKRSAAWSPPPPAITAGRWRYAAKLEGMRAVICMSRLVPENKVDRNPPARRRDPHRRRQPGRRAGRGRPAGRARRAWSMVPPFDHPAVIAGQGTLGLEIDRSTCRTPRRCWCRFRAAGSRPASPRRSRRVSPSTQGHRRFDGARRGDEGEPRCRPAGAGRGTADAGRFARRRHRPRQPADLRACAATCSTTSSCSPRTRSPRASATPMRWSARSSRAPAPSASRRCSPARSSSTAPIVVLLSGRNIDMELHRQHRLRRMDERRGAQRMSRMTILTEADLRKIVQARSRRRRLRRERLPRAGDAAGRDAADPAARHSRASRRGRREDGLCAGHRRLRHQDQPRLLRQSEARPAQRQRHDGAAVSAKTGLVEALLLDNGYLTDVRTAAAGAVAAKHLSRADCAGRRDLRRRRAGAAAARGADAGAADPRGAHLGARRRRRPKPRRASCASGSASPCAPSAIRGKAVAGADIIVTTTPADRADPAGRTGCRPGQHITAMGSDAEHKNEIDPAVLATRRLYVADSLKQTRRLGELHHAIAAGLVAADADVRRARRSHRRHGAGPRVAEPTSPSPTSPAPACRTPRSPRSPATAPRAANAGTIFES